LDHIYSLFDEWVLAEPYLKARVHANGNLVITWGFQTISYEAFNISSELFLINNIPKKDTSKEWIQNQLTNRGLAF